MFVRANVVYWRSKKQVVARSSAEAEYRAMTFATCKMILLNGFLADLGFPISLLMTFFVTTKVLQRIVCFMIEKNTLKLIVTLFLTKFTILLFKLSIHMVSINLLMNSLRCCQAHRITKLMFKICGLFPI